MPSIDAARALLSFRGRLPAWSVSLLYCSILSVVSLSVRAVGVAASVVAAVDVAVVYFVLCERAMVLAILNL